MWKRKKGKRLTMTLLVNVMIILQCILPVLAATNSLPLVNMESSASLNADDSAWQASQPDSHQEEPPISEVTSQAMDSYVEKEEPVSSSIKPEGSMDSSTLADIDITSAASEPFSSESSENSGMDTKDEGKPKMYYGFEPEDNRPSPEEKNKKLLSRASTYTVEMLFDDVQFLEQTFSDGYNEDRWYPKRIHETGEVAYCVEHGISIPNVWQGGYTPKEISDEMYQRISLADFYGRTSRGGDALRNEYMVQLYIWELQGVRIQALYYKDHPEWAPWVSMSDYAAFKAEIQPKVDAFFRKPSFNSSSIKLKPGQSVTLTDTNGVVSMYEDTPRYNNTNLTVTKNGNSLTLTAKANSKSGSIQFRYNLPFGFSRGTPLYYENPASQNVTVCSQGDPVGFQLNIEIENLGDLKLVKTSDDGVVSGVKIRVVGGGWDWTATTNAAGEIFSPGWTAYDDKGKPYQYVVTELNVPGRYNTPASQTITFEPGKTTTVKFSNTLKKGSLKLVKTSEDGIVSGLKFEITGNSQTYTKTTDANGAISVKNLQVYDKNNKKITYTAKELSAPGRYVQPASQTFTLTEDKTTTIKFDNALKKGNVKLVKTSEDGVVSGLTFKITGFGQTFERTTDAAGEINLTGVRVYDDKNKVITYTVEEIKTPDRYVQPAKQTFTLTDNKTKTIKFDNKLKKWQLTVTKADKEMSTPQGNATLVGAKYGLYKGDTLLDTYEIDSSYRFQTKIYSCGDDYTLREIEPSPGYLLDETVYQVGVSPGSTKIEMNPTEKTVTEQVIKGRVQIFKFWENPEDAMNAGLREPEPDAVFELYLTESGSYADAAETERDLLTTDEYGMAVSKDLPAGWYTAHQTEGKASYSLAPDFQICIDEDGKSYSYYVANVGIVSEVRIIKRDADSDKIIPVSGIGFMIKDLSTGEFIRLQIKYPEPQEIDVFYTGDQGYLVLPQKLLKGEYELYEVLAPQGYVLDETPIPFTVTGGEEPIEVVKYNHIQKGGIKLQKTGSVLTGWEETAGIYQPVYEELPLAGAEYELTAAEDIITPDGTLQCAKDQVMGTCTTDADGKAVFEDLHLGKYLYREITAPEGYVLDPEPHGIEIQYAGQEITLAKTEISAHDERQKVSLSVQKAMEQDEVFHAGMNGEILDVQFGLYAAEEIIAQDSTVIPEKGLIETVTMDADGLQTFETDLSFGEYYIQEIATNEKYFISDDKYPVTFAYGGQDTAVVEIMVNDGKPIENKLKRGSLQTTKVNAEDPTDKLPGGMFDVYADIDSDGQYTEDVDLLAGTLEEVVYGVYALQDIPAGHYLFNERTAPKGFIRDTNYYPFEIVEDGQLVEFDSIPGKDFPNHPKKGAVQTTKVNAEDPSDKLTGGVFDLYRDTNKDGKYTKGIDKPAGTLVEVKYGIYELHDIPAGDYLFHERTAPKGFAADPNYYPFEIVEDGQLVKFESIPGQDFPNHPSSLPQTGDSSNIVLPLILAGSSCTILIFSLTFKHSIKKKRRKAENEIKNE